MVYILVSFSPKELAEIPGKIELGATKDYCPVALRDSYILQKGSKNYSAKYQVRCHQRKLISVYSLGFTTSQQKKHVPLFLWNHLIISTRSKFHLCVLYFWGPKVPVKRHISKLSGYIMSTFPIIFWNLLQDNLPPKRKRYCT